jgi:hypothetical protein
MLPFFAEHQCLLCAILRLLQGMRPLEAPALL